MIDLGKDISSLITQLKVHSDLTASDAMKLVKCDVGLRLPFLPLRMKAVFLIIDLAAEYKII